MSALKIAKFVVCIFSILLMACFCLIVSKITDTRMKSNPKNKIALLETQKSDIQLDADETIENIFACQPYICITTKSPNQINKILLIDPQTGHIIQTITLKKK